MTSIRWFVSGLILMVLPLQSCGILETKPSDSTLRSDRGKIDPCSGSGGHTTRAEGALPSSGGCTMTGIGDALGLRRKSPGKLLRVDWSALLSHMHAGKVWIGRSVIG